MSSILEEGILEIEPLLLFPLALCLGVVGLLEPLESDRNLTTARLGADDDLSLVSCTDAVAVLVCETEPGLFTTERCGVTKVLVLTDFTASSEVSLGFCSDGFSVGLL